MCPMNYSSSLMQFFFPWLRLKGGTINFWMDVPHSSRKHLFRRGQEQRNGKNLPVELHKVKGWGVGGGNMTCKFKPMSVNTKEEQRATAEPNIRRTSVKGTKWKKDLWEMTKLPVHTTPWTTTSWPSLRHHESLVPSIKAHTKGLQLDARETVNMLTLIKRTFLSQ